MSVKKSVKLFVCQSCGSTHNKWQGQCENCHSWNTLVEEKINTQFYKNAGGKKNTGGLALESLGDIQKVPERYSSGYPEFNRVCGGGLVPGSSILIGGDPGIGKSTLLLQVACQLAQNNSCLYITGEESLEQIRLRAHRLQLAESSLCLAAGTNLADIHKTIQKEKPSFIIIDSIQTVYSDALDSAPGTVGQVRICCYELLQLTKGLGATLFIIGHVTKEGMIAGPRVLEHMVDAVFYFEGDRYQQYRIIRSIKNRFGPTNEIGVFEMSHNGLQEVLNPSSLFLSHHENLLPGVCIYAGIEGTRPILLEVQALLAKTGYVTPKRTVVGWDSGRLSMVLAVLESRCSLSFSGYDVYLNIAGGLRIQEPAVDLAVAAALLSAKFNTAIAADAVFFGEVGLTGEVRGVAHTLPRLSESKKLGFSKAFCYYKEKKNGKMPLSLQKISTVTDLMQYLKR